LYFLNLIGCRQAILGGCTFCDYGFGEKRSEKKVLEEAKEILDKIEADNEGYESAYVNINAIGSFIDDKEISGKVREYI